MEAKEAINTPVSNELDGDMISSQNVTKSSLEDTDVNVIETDLNSVNNDDFDESVLS